MASLIEFLREVKDPTNIFSLRRNYVRSDIEIKSMKVFLDVIQQYHTKNGMRLDNDVLFYVIKRIHNYHFIVYEDGATFIHYHDDIIWHHTHLLKDEIFDDDINLCLTKGRILFEEM